MREKMSNWKIVFWNSWNSRTYFFSEHSQKSVCSGVFSLVVACGLEFWNFMKRRIQLHTFFPDVLQIFRCSHWSLWDTSITTASFVSLLLTEISVHCKNLKIYRETLLTHSQPLQVFNILKVSLQKYNPGI